MYPQFPGRGESCIRPALVPQGRSQGSPLHKGHSRSPEKFGGPPSHALDSAEPVLSAVEGLHPAYFHDDYAILGRSHSGGQESPTLSAKARSLPASPLRLTSIKLPWL